MPLCEQSKDLMKFLTAAENARYTKAIVKVKLESNSGGKSPGVRSKITTFIGGVRVGRETFNTKRGRMVLFSWRIMLLRLRCHMVERLA